MYKAVQNCTNCGADLKLDDLRGTNCPYCQVVYPHHSQAQQHVQVIGQVMGQMMNQQAHVQNQWRGAFGVPPVNPPMMGPPGGPPPGMPGQAGYGYNPYGDPNQMVQAHMQHAQALGKRITVIVLVSTVGMMVVIGAIIALSLL